MIVSIAAAALAVQLSMAPGSAAAPDLVAPVSPQAVQYHVPAYPPPCEHGWDLSARDGLCYPNGYLPPQEQAARQQRYYRGGRYPVPCGHGSDVDSRDGRCYPTGESGAVSAGPPAVLRRWLLPAPATGPALLSGLSATAGAARRPPRQPPRPAKPWCTASAAIQAGHRARRARAYGR